MLGEPPRSQGDIHFRLFGFPVRIHPFFWLIAGLLGLGSGGKLIHVFIWIVAMFLGILIHELGHALAMRSCGLRPWITLYGMGGLTSYDTSQLMQSSASDWKKQIFISFAGPGAGFLLAAVLLLLCHVTGHEVVFDFGTKYPYFVDFNIYNFASRELWRFVYSLVFISVIWGLFNLLPIYPLDGGQIMREILIRIDRRTGFYRALVLSTIVAGVIAIYFLFSMARSASNGDEGRSASLLPVILFGFLCYNSWRMLKMFSNSGRRW
jgi:membrane-associated protease RseP (regulator of RpoE activity)